MVGERPRMHIADHWTPPPTEMTRPQMSTVPLLGAPGREQCLRPGSLSERRAHPADRPGSIHPARTSQPPLTADTASLLPLTPSCPLPPQAGLPQLQEHNAPPWASQGPQVMAVRCPGGREDSVPGAGSQAGHVVACVP